MPRVRKWLTMREVITFSRAKWATRPAATAFNDKQSFMISARRVGGRPKDDGDGGMCESLFRATIKIDVIIIIFFRVVMSAYLAYLHCWCTRITALLFVVLDWGRTSRRWCPCRVTPTAILRSSWRRGRAARRDAHSQNSRFSSTQELKVIKDGKIKMCRRSDWDEIESMNLFTDCTRITPITIAKWSQVECSRATKHKEVGIINDNEENPRECANCISEIGKEMWLHSKVVK